MSVNKKEALELAKRVEEYINSDTLTENEKETIVSEAAAAYDENINSGWIPYRDEMSVDKLFTEWSHQGDKFSDIKGNEFIDCLGGFGIFLTGHRNEEIIRTVHAHLCQIPRSDMIVQDSLQRTCMGPFAPFVFIAKIRMGIKVYHADLLSFPRSGVCVHQWYRHGVIAPDEYTEFAGAEQFVCIILHCLVECRPVK